MVYKDDILHTLAAVHFFSLPDPDLLKELYGMLHVCGFLDKKDVVVVDVKTLTDVVGVIFFHHCVQERRD